MAKLIIYEELDGEETIFENFELSIQRILIGSGEDNHLVLDIPDVDPVHASLELRNNYWVIQDLGGPGGTLVNGERVDGPRRLQDNDLIELQTLKIRFQDEDVVYEEAEDTTEFGLDEIAGRKPREMSSGVWFGTVAGVTLAVIFAIIFILVVLAYFDVLQLTDLLPLS